MIPAILAPLITPLLQNGLGMIANAVLAKGQNYVEDKLGVKLTPNLTPEMIEKLKVTEMEHEEELMRLAQENRKLDLVEIQQYLLDMQDARGMQKAALAQSDEFSKRFIYYFAIGWSAVTAIYIGAITFFAIPEHNIRFADTVLGFLLGTALAGIFQFFYGSSRSSQAKDNTLNEVIKNVTGK